MGIPDLLKKSSGASRPVMTNTASLSNNSVAPDAVRTVTVCPPISLTSLFIKSLSEPGGREPRISVDSDYEKALAHDLIRRDISYFLPMSWKVRRKSRRTVKSLLPLFAGYLFCCGKENDRLELLRTDRVANVIEVTDQEKIILVNLLRRVVLRVMSEEDNKDAVCVQCWAGDHDDCFVKDLPGGCLHELQH